MSLVELCRDIVNKMQRANFANALVVAAKLDLKGDGRGFELDSFWSCIKNELASQIEGNKQIEELYLLTDLYQKYSQDAHLNKEYLVEAYLCDFWLRVHNGC